MNEKNIVLVQRQDRGKTNVLYAEKGDAVFCLCHWKLISVSGCGPVLDENGLCEIFALGPARTPGNGVFEIFMKCFRDIIFLLQTEF